MTITEIFHLISPYRQSTENSVSSPSDPDSACEDNKKCGGVPQREVPVYNTADHRHPQR